MYVYDKVPHNGTVSMREAEAVEERVPVQVPGEAQLVGGHA